MRIVFFALLAAATSSVGVLQQPPSLSTNEQLTALARLIEAGDFGAVVRAGQSGNPAFIPFLKRKVHEPTIGASRDEPNLTVQIALIRLEDIETMQELWCQATRESTSPPVQAFQFIGGWYSLRALDAIISGAGEVAFQRAVRAAQPTDLSFALPRFLAVAVLEQIAPTGPNGPEYRGRYGHYAGLDREAEAWHQWIADNKADLSKLRPIGEAADLTDKACKDGKPTKRSLADRILAGDLDAIGEAARSGNRSFVPYLRRELNDPRHKNTSLSPIEFARIALARLGEADQMQELWCRAISEDPDLGEGDLKAKIWDTWISDHKDELSRLMPTGEGVDLSDKACKNGKPIRKQ